jgi:NTP pyrophosphatase (non-canonical NTP hydrolase)
MVSISELTEQVRKFSDERDWNQFHSVKNLILALVGEVGELAAEVQWLTSQEIEERIGDKEIAAEIADIALYLIRLSDVLRIDLSEAISQKLLENAEKYPVDKSRGNALKYNKLT